MQPLRTLSLLLLLTSLPLSLRASAPLVLDLKGALERTAQDNKQLLMSLERVSQADAQRRRSLAPLFPSISLKAAQKHSRVALSFLPPELAKLIVNPVKEADYGASLSLKMNPSLYATYKANQMSAEAAAERHAATKQTLLAQTAQIYFLHVRNLEKLKALDSSYATALSLLTLVEAQAEAGMANDLDVIRARQRVKTEESRKAAHAAELASSWLKLREQLSLPRTMPVEFTPVSIPIACPVSITKLQEDRLLKARADYRENEGLLEQAVIARKAARLQRLPSFEVLGDFGFRKKQLFGNEKANNTWALGLQVSIPVFDGFGITADTMLATATMIERRHALQDLKQKITREQEEAYEAIQARLVERAALAEAVDLAHKELERAQDLFTEGVARHQDVVDAQDRLTEAQDGAIDAAYGHLLAVTALGLAQGTVQETLLSTVGL